MKHFLLEGKTALISGGGNGIARAQAELFAREGANVVIGDVDQSEGERVAAQINASGGKARFIRLDVTQEASWTQAVALAVAEFGALTTLVNTAGIYHAAALESETAEAMLRLVKVNQIGVLLGMKAALPALRACGNASILNMASGAAIRAYPGQIAYAATKGAVRIISLNAAGEYGRFGIRVNSIYPGVVQTGMLKDAPPAAMAAQVATTPMGRIGTPEDIANGSLYLCSDLALYVTGAELVIDGGLGTR
jgi:NAD(P)-dependent dehydrogenase (short-subunit alcohol dehydrogenase family)